MAYQGPGLSPVEMARGAKAITDILSSGDVLQENKAKAELASSKAGLAKLRLKGQQEYMKAEAATPPTPPDLATTYGKSPEGDGATISGENTYGFMNLSQELQQRKNALAQEENNAKLLAPEDRRLAEVRIVRMQGQVDNLESKLLKEVQSHAGQRFSLLDSIHDEATLQGARQYFSRELGTLADKAIADGKMSPDNRERFINDKLNSFLPKTYDAAGQVMINTQKNGMISIKDQATLKEQEIALKRANAYVKKAEADAQRQYSLTTKALKSHDKDQIANSIKLTTAQLRDASRQVREFEDKAQQYESDAKSAVDQDQIDRDRRLADEYRMRAKELEQHEKPLEDTLKALGKDILPESTQQRVEQGQAAKTDEQKNQDLYPNAPPLHAVVAVIENGKQVQKRYMGGDPMNKTNWLTLHEWKGKIKTRGK